MKQGWEIKKLGEVCTFCSGYTPKESELLECGAVPYFKVSDMNHCDNLKYLTHTSLFLEDGCKVYPKHTIVFPKNGAAISTNKKRILAQDSVVDLNTGGVVANDALVYFEYLYLYFLNLDFRLHTRRGAVPTLDIAELKNKSIPVPPREEQERIVAELDCLSGVIERKREQLRELDALAQSIFYQMFGDPITNEKGWEVILLKQAALLKAGKAIKANELSEESDLALYPCYGGNGIRGYINKKSHNGQFPIIGRQGALCGNVVYAQGEFYATEHAVVCNNIIDSINPLWLYYALKFNNLNRYAQGVAQPGISVNIINEMPLIYPPLYLQQEFAKKIDRIEQQKKLISQSIKEAEDLFNSRMSYYFN